MTNKETSDTFSPEIQFLNVLYELMHSANILTQILSMTNKQHPILQKETPELETCLKTFLEVLNLLYGFCLMLLEVFQMDSVKNTLQNLKNYEQVMQFCIYFRSTFILQFKTLIMEIEASEGNVRQILQR